MSPVQELTRTERQTGIVQRFEANPVMVLLDEKRFDEFYLEIEREVQAFVPDLATATSRAKIAALARKVASTKTAIDDAGKKLNEEARKKIGIVDASRRTIRERLDKLRDEARRPLTEWETAEEARIEARDRDLADLERAAAVTMDATAADIEERIVRLTAMEITAETHQEYAGRATRAREHALTILSANLARIQREEAERAELAQLRAEAAERTRRQEEREAAERAEQARIEREQMEAELEREEAQRKAAAEEAERQRIAEAEERARSEAVAAAEREKREAADRHAAELRRIEDEREAERKAIAAEAATKAAAEQAARDAEEVRQRNRDHRSKIMAAAKEAIMEAGSINEAKAKLIVSAITAGSVPAVTLRF